MNPRPTTIPLLVIAGPTAAGKTELALQLAEALDAEIISADSMQIYRGLDVGTAKPTAAERARVPVHLVDSVDPTAEYTVVDFQREARRTIQQIYRRGRLPILCGGTGLYLRALLRHLDFPPGPRDGALRQQLQAEAHGYGAAHLHARLAELDPEAARNISPGDTRRIVRALEVIQLTGLPMSAQRRVDHAPAIDYNALQYVLTAPRAVLFARIDQRVERMMAAGWLQEVQRLRAEGVTLAHQSMQAIGYRRLMAYLDGEPPAELNEVRALIQRDTRRYAKRQLTWLRAEPGFRWLAPATEAQRSACLTMIVQDVARVRLPRNGG